MIQADYINEKLALHWDEPAGWSRLLTTGDHKIVGLRYIATAFLFFSFAGIESLLMRIQLAIPNNTFINPEVYNQWFTMHGTLMVFFFAAPILFGLGSYFIPLMIGTRDMAFPRLNAFGYWIFLFSGLFIYISSLFGLAPYGGWLAYPPLTGQEHAPDLNMDFWILGLSFLSIGTTSVAINFIVTIFKMRAPDMTLMRIPIFVWTILIVSFAILIAVPALNTANILLFLERRLDFLIYDRAVGGTSFLWQHLFWFFGYAYLMIILLPALGIVSEIVQTFSRRRLVGYRLMIAGIIISGIVGFILWLSHLFVGSISLLTNVFVVLAVIVIGILLTIQVSIWIATLAFGNIQLKTPLLWVFAFLIFFLFGAMSSVLLPVAPQLGGTYFSVAQLHYLLLGGAVFPAFAAVYYWGPKMMGRCLNERLGQIHVASSLIGGFLTFFPMQILGLLGMPSRIYTYSSEFGWDLYNLLATIGGGILALSILIFVMNVIYSAFMGEDADANPWGGATLEWATPTPPPGYNFEIIPHVTSATPLWDTAQIDPDDTEKYTAVPSHDLSDPYQHETLSTSVINATPQAIIHLPQDSLQPFVLALMLLLLFIGVLLILWWLSILSTVGVIASLIWWFLPHPKLSRSITS